MANREADKSTFDADAKALLAHRLRNLSRWAWWMEFVVAAVFSCAMSLNFLSMRVAHPTSGGKAASVTSFVGMFFFVLPLMLLAVWLTFGPIRFFADFFAELLATDTGETGDESGGKNASTPNQKGCNRAGPT